MTWIRISVAVLTIVQAMIAALLGFGEYIGQEWKIALVVLSAGVSVALNQLPRIQQGSLSQGDSSWTSSPPPPPHG